MKNNNAKRSDAQVKSDLKILKAKGLYKGDLRKPITRYGKGQARKFADVIRGSAKVVSVPKLTTARAARVEARAVAEAHPDRVRAKGAKLIVRVSRKSEHVIYQQKAHKILTRHKNDRGEILTYEFVSALSDQPLDDNGYPLLNKNETFALPFSRGVDGLDYMTRASSAEILALANEYRQKVKNKYRDVNSYIMIAYRD